MKTAKKIFHKAEGVGFDLVSGMSRWGNSVASVARSPEPEAAQAPVVTRVPSFVKHIEDFAERKESDMPRKGNQPWWCEDEGADYLAVVVRDAKVGHFNASLHGVHAY